MKKAKQGCPGLSGQPDIFCTVDKR